MNRTLQPAPGAAAPVRTRHSAQIPRWALVLVGATLALLIGAVATVRLTGFSPTEAPGAMVEQRMLAFADTPDGAVRVTDVATGDTLALMRGEQGFLRGVLRGMARDRRAHEIGSAPPYQLSLHDDGRLVLSDPTTGQRIDLASFGADNAAVFLRWLPSQQRASTPSIAAPGASTP